MKGMREMEKGKKRKKRWGKIKEQNIEEREKKLTIPKTKRKAKRIKQRRKEKKKLIDREVKKEPNRI